MKPKRAKLIMRVDIKGSILSLKPGQTAFFSAEDVQPQYVRNCAYRLNNQGYNVSCSMTDANGGIFVTMNE